jgi:3-phenylpropionate/cinnamic acid dioxygenase small subunit
VKPTPEIRNEIRDFLYREASLLDTFRLQEWLELLADDVRYWIPTIETVRGSSERYRDDVPYYHLVDWDKRIIQMRLAQIETGLNHCEIPASVAQRIVSNVSSRRQTATTRRRRIRTSRRRSFVTACSNGLQGPADRPTEEDERAVEDRGAKSRARSLLFAANALDLPLDRASGAPAALSVVAGDYP